MGISKPYFKNLNGLRFFAALLVFMQHSTMFKKGLSPSLNFFSDPLFNGIGGYGVKFFFVLSGFLITYLLSHEIKATGDLDIKKFYVRRALRIWPLYFLVGIGGTIVGPMVLSKLGIVAESSVGTNLGFLFLFAVNFQLIFFEYNRGIVEILWSVCIEEQFYLIWAPMVKHFQNALLGISVLAIAIGLATPFAFDLLASSTQLEMTQPNYFFTTSAFLFFGFGSLGAYLLRRNEALFEGPLFHKGIQLFGLVLSVVLIFTLIPVNPALKKYAYNFFVALLFMYVILVAIAPNSVLSLENPFLKTLGKISYGIYVYHTFVLQIMVRVFYKIFPSPSLLVYEVLFPIVALGTTVLISYLSYHWFESFFLRRKPEVKLS